MEENKKQTDLIIILDHSGSMQSIQQSTVDGFNVFLNEQENAEGEAFLTLVQFDDRYQIDYSKVPVKEVNPLILGETFVPRATTALLDAIGKTIEEFTTDRDVVCVIITDGEENASTVYKREAILNMIKTKESDGWKFIFLAANQDAIQTGRSIGISHHNSITYAASDAGVGNTYQSFSQNVSSYRSSKLSKSIDQAEQDLVWSDKQRNDSKKD